MIIDLYVDRNELAIDETATKYGNYCFAISKNIVKNHGDAEECVNETYLKAWNHIPPEIPRKLCVFLGRIVRNLSLDRYKFNRTKKRGNSEFELLLSELEDCLSTSSTIEDELDANLTLSVVNAWIRSQEAEKRIMFVKRYWDAQSISELADFFQMSESKVKSTLFRMRKNLKIHLEKEGIE